MERSEIEAIPLEGDVSFPAAGGRARAGGSARRRSSEGRVQCKEAHTEPQQPAPLRPGSRRRHPERATPDRRLPRRRYRSHLHGDRVPDPGRPRPQPGLQDFRDLRRQGSWEAEVIDELRPGDDEIVIPKTSSSLFNSTNCEYVLRNLGTEYVMVMGMLTDQCVETAVRDGCDRGFLITLVDDACAAYSDERHREACTVSGAIAVSEPRQSLFRSWNRPVPHAPLQCQPEEVLAPPELRHRKRRIH